MNKGNDIESSKQPSRSTKIGFYASLVSLISIILHFIIVFTINSYNIYAAVPILGPILGTIIFYAFYIGIIASVIELFIASGNKAPLKYPAIGLIISLIIVVLMLSLNGTQYHLIT